MELLLVLIVAIFVLRPRDWQCVAVGLGKALRLWRYYQQQFKRALARLENPINRSSTDSQPPSHAASQDNAQR